jgi:hypothetical protein
VGQCFQAVESAHPRHAQTADLARHPATERPSSTAGAMRTCMRMRDRSAGEPTRAPMPPAASPAPAFWYSGMACSAARTETHHALVVTRRRSDLEHVHLQSNRTLVSLTPNPTKKSIEALRRISKRLQLLPSWAGLRPLGQEQQCAGAAAQAKLCFCACTCTSLHCAHCLHCLHCNRRRHS